MPGSTQFYTLAGSTNVDLGPEGKVRVRGPKTRTTHQHPDPVRFPAGIKRLEVGLSTGHFFSHTRVVLSLGPTRSKLQEVAVFRGADRSPQEAVFELRPDLVGPTAYLQLEFKTSPAQISYSQERIDIDRLVFRCDNSPE
ncbi:MAG: hypothetical protein HY815_19770 [Candidatus Riflebacteria bacterium]|nr:hypothetical protein [Candidatus Riflebacteria bacterium]